MQSQEKFSFLRTILRKLGLSPEAVDDIIERILDFLSEKEEKSLAKEYPYRMRDDFLSPAELSFYLVLKNTIGDRALICPKVSLRDLFYAKTIDPRWFRILTNKIDRKHVDFVICDLKTVQPLCAIELDDKSHRQAKRQERDAFVEKVFNTAKLPLLRVSVRKAYSSVELNERLAPYLDNRIQPPPAPVETVEASQNAAPKCPKCGSEMVLRTAKSGPNQGEKFWGCSNFPKCRGLVKVQSAT